LKLGVSIFITDISVRPDRLAQEVEARGFNSLYVSEHTHIPIGRRTPWPPAGHELPEEYKRTYDPFVSLTAAAVVTEKIRLGTSICLLAQRDPVITAKEIASLDHLSGGRFSFGIGFGWNEDELEDHGVVFRDRWDVVRENMMVMLALWSPVPKGYEGKFARVLPSWAYPKPFSGVRPPVMIGGRAGPRLFKHISEYADGWLAMGGGGVRKELPMLRHAEETAGREPGSLSVSIMSDAVPDKVKYFADLDVTETLCLLPSGDEQTVLKALDELAPLVEWSSTT
jgi:probable F420-dependent oxidoreductase